MVRMIQNSLFIYFFKKKDTASITALIPILRVAQPLSPMEFIIHKLHWQKKLEYTISQSWQLLYSKKGYKISSQRKRGQKQSQE